MEYCDNNSSQRQGTSSFITLYKSACSAVSPRGILSFDETPAPDEDESLDEAVRDEREYVRRRLREELQHEPTEEEIDEWLRQHTEGY